MKSDLIRHVHSAHSAPCKVFFSAGEPSGDAHAASLIRELYAQNPMLQIVGYGGPEMEKAGMALHYDMTQKAVMFLGRALANILTFRSLYKKAERYFADNDVQAVVLIDFPGFNWWVAKAAKKHGIPVYYFMPPQLWAWAGWRIKKMRKLVNHTFATMPFEARWFRSHGCETTELGHPFLEEAKHHSIDHGFVADLKSDDVPILTLLPGSRDQEVAANLDDMLKAVIKIRKKNPNVRPVIAAFKQSHVDSINQRLAALGLAIPVYVGKTQELIRAAHFALTVSGSVTMELLANHVPTVVYFRVGKMAHFAQRFLRRIRFITLPNLLYVDQLTPGSPYFNKKTRVIPSRPSEQDWDDMLFPEFLVSSDSSDEVANIFLEWLDSPQLYQSVREQLKVLHEKLDGKKSPFVSAAQILLADMSPKRTVTENPTLPDEVSTSPPHVRQQENVEQEKNLASTR